MIIGIGNDLIDIRRIERTLERFGDRFINRIYTDVEQKKSEGRTNRAASYAKRFAAKEACSKALGTGFRKGVFLARYGCRESQGWKTDDSADRRCRETSGGIDTGRYGSSN